MMSLHVTRLLVVAFITLQLIVLVNTDVDTAKSELKTARANRLTSKNVLREAENKLSEHQKFEKPIPANEAKLKDLQDKVKIAKDAYWKDVADVDQKEIDYIKEKMKLVDCGWNCNKTGLWFELQKKNAIQQYHKHPNLYFYGGTSTAIVLALVVGGFIGRATAPAQGPWAKSVAPPGSDTLTKVGPAQFSIFAIIISVVVMLVVVSLASYFFYFRKRDAEDSDEYEEGKGKRDKVAKPSSGISGGSSVMAPSSTPAKLKPSAASTPKLKQSAPLTIKVSVKPYKASKMPIAQSGSI